MNGPDSVQDGFCRVFYSGSLRGTCTLQLLMVAPLELKQMESRRRTLREEPLQGKWTRMPAFFPGKLCNLMFQSYSILVSSCRQPECVFNAMCCEVSATSPAEACCGVSFSSP